MLFKFGVDLLKNYGAMAPPFHRESFEENAFEIWCLAKTIDALSFVKVITMPTETSSLGLM